MTNTDDIRRIRKNESTGQLNITIPRNSNFEKGDYVKIVKVKFSEESE